MKTRSLLLLVLSLVLAACGTTEQQPTKKVAEYAAMTVDTSTAQIFTDFTAELQGEQVVEIRPRVSGYLDRIAVEEGSQVRKGQLIFKINEADFRAQLDAAIAQVDAAKAAVENAQLEIRKLAPLVEKNIISQYELTTAQANLAATKAQQRAAESNATNARISLSYTNITSPVSGVVGRIVVRAGTLVSSSQSEALATVSSEGPAAAYFSMNEKLLLELAAKSSTFGLTQGEAVKKIPPVNLILADGETYSETGQVEVASGIVDMTTGSIQLKATFLSAVVQIPRTVAGAVVVPQHATYDVQDRIMVYVVDSSGVVSSRAIEVAGTTGTSYVVSSGLKKGDVILTEGIDYVKQGDTVKIKK